MHLVFSGYSRTLYFKTCLDSIKDQITDQDVSLVLDGPSNDLGVQQNVETFINTFKDRYSNIEKRIHVSPYKLPHDHNIINSFRVGFETSDSDYIVFIEDDIEFSPLFIKQMDIMWNFVKNRNDIATFSCFTRETMGWEDERLSTYKHYLVPQHNQCATGISRKFYDFMLKELAHEYLYNTVPWYDSSPLLKYGSFTILNRILRDKYQIYYNTPLENIEDDTLVSGSWDVFYSRIAYKYKQYRISTVYNYLKHIGEYGVNTDPYHFNKDWKTLNEKTSFIKNQLIDGFIFDKNYAGFVRDMYDFQGKNWKIDGEIALKQNSVVRY